jgi:multidrug efflux pump subunit AcrB
MILSDAAIKNRITILVLCVLFVGGGVFSYLVLPRESAPDVPVPYIMVTAIYEGVSPEDIESSVTMKIEKQLTGLKGLKEVRSSSVEGMAIISIEFMPDVDVNNALQWVKDKVDQARGDLPDDVKPPIVTEINVAEMPIMIVSMSGTISPVRLKVMADELQDRIEAVPGVLTCDIIGAPEREIRLEIDPDRLAEYGLTIPELLRLVPAENVNISAGGLETAGTKFNVRVPAEVHDPGAVEHFLLAVRDGRPIYLGDVARVTDTFKDRDSYSRLDGQDSITLAVKKRIGADILAISDGVKGILAEAGKQSAGSVKFEMSTDRSKDIKLMLADLENNLFAAFVLVVVIMLVTLGWRASIIVALAVPLSMLMSFTVLHLMGYTLNMIVLFSLVLVVGMLVDDAIVIVENIYRHRQLGYGKFDAAMKGTAEVAWPVITSTLTTVAAFGPMAFWPGIMGSFMKYLPITVIVVLLCSLFVAMFVSPVMCTLFASPPKHRAKDHSILRVYRGFLRFVIGHRLAAIALVVIVLVGLGVVYGKKGYGVEFFPDVDPKRAVISIRCPQGTNIKETDRICREIEAIVEPFHAKGEINHVVANVGTAGGTGLNFGGASTGPHMANIMLMFPDFEQRVRPSAEIIPEIRAKLTDIVGAEVKIDKEKMGPPMEAPVTVRFIGPDFHQLERLSEDAGRQMAGVGGLVNLRSNLEATRPELVFRPDRQRAMLLGVNTAAIGNFLKTAVFGAKVGTYRQPLGIVGGAGGRLNDEYDITIRLPESQRVNIDDLFRLRVPNATGQAVPLGSLGSFDYTGGFGTIYRISQKRAVTLTADAEGRLPDDVLKDVQARLAKMDLPAGYEIRYAGEKEEQDKAVKFLFIQALPVGLLLITLVMVIQFNTLRVPLIIMATVPLSLIGVLLGLLAVKLPFGVIMTGIGVICLAGVVVKNGIVLLDYTRKCQGRGMNVVEASIEAGVTRLRPVLLTAAATVIGLVPTALGMSFDVHTFEWVWRSESSAMWKSMAVAVIYGLSFATVLTLVVVPTLYVTFDRLAARLGLGSAPDPKPTPPLPPSKDE